MTSAELLEFPVAVSIESQLNDWQEVFEKEEVCGSKELNAGLEDRLVFRLVEYVDSCLLTSIELAPFGCAIIDGLTAAIDVLENDLDRFGRLVVDVDLSGGCLLCKETRCQLESLAKVTCVESGSYVRRTFQSRPSETTRFWR